MEDLKRKEQSYRHNQQQNYNRRHVAHDMPELQSGHHVWIKDMLQRGTVVSTAGTLRSYIVETSRSSLRRNRFHSCGACHTHWGPWPVIGKHHSSSRSCYISNWHIHHPWEVWLQTQSDSSEQEMPSCQSQNCSSSLVLWENVNTYPEWMLGNNNSLTHTEIYILCLKKIKIKKVTVIVYCVK